jgi:FtsH-binding integral membrane protein
MNALARIPFWTWFLFSVAFCYWLWNPYFSLFQLLMTDMDAAWKTFSVVITLIVVSLYVAEGHRTLNAFGIILFIALFGCIFWIVSKMGLHHYDSAKWWGQWIGGLFLALALQGGRIYRSITGRVPVGTTIEADSDHHHS